MFNLARIRIHCRGGLATISIGGISAESVRQESADERGSGLDDNQAGTVTVAADTTNNGGAGGRRGRRGLRRHLKAGT
jgi:hypothetical protein